LDDHQERAIFNAKPHIMISNINEEDDDLSLDIQVTQVKKEYSVSHTNIFTRTSTTSPMSSSDSSIDTSKHSSSFRPFCSVWDRLDAWSQKEHRRIEDYYATVQQQNEKIAAVSTLVVKANQGQEEETVTTPGIPAKKQFGLRGPVVSTAATSTTPRAPHYLRGRLRRQHSWNGRDSNRDLIQATGSIMAIADEDGSLSDLWSALDGPLDDTDEHEARSGEDSVQVISASRMEKIRVSITKTSTMKKQNSARRKANQRVMDLVM
jgi:hypothetical protein